MKKKLIKVRCKVLVKTIFLNRIVYTCTMDYQNLWSFYKIIKSSGILVKSLAIMYNF